MYSVRLWSVGRAPFLSLFYKQFERLMVRCHGLFAAIGYQRLERPVAWVEAGIKGFMFDCQMCGQCVLSDTGLSCPMNCPKGLRNGPCGGVRPNGHCEVEPEMRCVWVEAWRGATAMGATESLVDIQVPVDHRLKGGSSWLRAARLAAEGAGDREAVVGS